GGSGGVAADGVAMGAALPLWRPAFDGWQLGATVLSPPAGARAGRADRGASAPAADRSDDCPDAGPGLLDGRPGAAAARAQPAGPARACRSGRPLRA